MFLSFQFAFINQFTICTSHF